MKLLSSIHRPAIHVWFNWSCRCLCRDHPLQHATRGFKVVLSLNTGCGSSDFSHAVSIPGALHIPRPCQVIRPDLVPHIPLKSITRRRRISRPQARTATTKSLGNFRLTFPSYKAGYSSSILAKYISKNSCRSAPSSSESKYGRNPVPLTHSTIAW